METNKSYRILALDISPNQRKDAGMAFTLISLLIFASTGLKFWLIVSISLLLIDMVYSSFFHYPAIFWFSLANLMSVFASRILLSLIFFFVITPMGLLRKLFGLLAKPTNDSKYDPMRLKLWKKSTESVFKSRNYKYSKKDLINPY